jgi:hypothetical protein
VRRHDNGWGYRVDLGPDPATGKRRQVSKQGFRTKREAEQAAQAVLKAAAEGAVTNRTHRTVGEYLDEWLQMQQPRLRATTHHSYAMAVNRIKSGLGSAKLQSLTPLQVERFYRELTSARLGPRLLAEDDPQHAHRAPQGARRRRAARARDPQRRGRGTTARRRSQRSRHLEQRGARRSSSSRCVTIGCIRCSWCSPPPACVEARCSGCGGATSTSMPAIWRSPTRAHR